MRRSLSSVTLWLTVWFLFLATLLMVVVAVFVRKNSAGEYAQQQAGLNAVFISRLGGNGNTALQDLVLSTQPPGATHFLVDQAGKYAAHPDFGRIGTGIRQDFSAETLVKILQGGRGYTLDVQGGMVAGYAAIPRTNLIDVVSIQLSPVDMAIGRLTNYSYASLAVIIIIIYLFGAAIIWMLVGNPLSQLVRVAEHIGQGNLDHKLDLRKMHGELKVLANTLNSSGDRIKTLVSGLEERVRETNQAYLSLRESEERFRALFDSANDAIIVHDLESGAILDANPKFAELYGYERDEASALTIEDLSSGSPPYTHRSAVHWIRRARRSGPQTVGVAGKGHKSGRFFWVDLSMRVAVHRRTGAPAGFGARRHCAQTLESDSSGGLPHFSDRTIVADPV
jgi:PAS domain S-box-containing protein